MTFTAILTLPDPGHSVASAFSSGLEARERSQVQMKKTEKAVVFSITARDFTAYKASMLSLIKLLEVQQKVEALNESGNRAD